MGTRVDDTPELFYYGPYVDHRHYMLDEFARMNLFRAAEVHCVGIGEADMAVLESIAATGLGSTRQIGRGKKK